MDFAVSLLPRACISSRLEGLLGFPRGQFIIDDHQERLMPSTDLEDLVGKWVHFIVDGGVIALGYPLWFAIAGQVLPGSPSTLTANDLFSKHLPLAFAFEYNADIVHFPTINHHTERRI